MRHWSPRIVPPWSSSDLERILDDALRVLEDIGVECAHEAAGRRLADWKGTSYVAGRVHFAPASVREYLAEGPTASEELPEQDDVPFALGGCWAALYYCDPETQDVRPASSQEAAQMARLWDARGLRGVVPLVPGDVPPGLVTLAAERIALENSRHLGGSLPASDPEQVRFLMDMNLAAGRRFHLLEHVGISPLRLDPGGLERALQFANNPDVRVTLGGFMAMAGATAPLDPRSALVQSVAETIGFDILCTRLDLAGGGLGLTMDPFDFEYATISFGSPEWCLYRVLVFQIIEHLTGRPVRGGGFRSTGKRPDPQANCERTASVLWQALLGVRRFGGVGQLAIDEVFSPQQAVLDREILGYVERLISGMDVDGTDIDAVELIRKGIREGSFIGLADTVSRFRDFYYFPDIFRHWSLGRWRAEGKPSILGEAWTRAREEMATSTFALRDDQRKEIDRIYEKARSYLQNRT